MYKYRKLRGRIIEKYGSQAAFADALGISRQTVSNKMCNHFPFKQDEIEIWSSEEHLDIDRQDYGEYFFT